MPPAPCSLRGSAAPLLIRADAGGALGTGHVMRMLALSQAWMAHGGKVHMAQLSCPAPLQDRLRNEGIHLHTLNDTQRGSSDDASQLAALADSLNPAWIVLDGYDFDLDYQRRVKKAGFKLMVMDDYGYSPTWCADLILNQNLGAESFAYTNEIPNSRTLLGTNYVLLRKEFWNVTPKHAEPGQPIQNLLITLGGVDADNVTGKVLEALEEAASHKLNLRVLLGPGNPHLQELKTLSSNSRHEINFLQNVTDMPSQYQWADGVISAGGSTCYEWMRFGLSAAILCIADNQREIINALVVEGYAVELQLLRKGLNVANLEVLIRFLSGADRPSRGDSFPIDGQGVFQVFRAMREML